MKWSDYQKWAEWGMEVECTGERRGGGDSGERGIKGKGDEEDREGWGGEEQRE